MSMPVNNEKVTVPASNLPTPPHLITSGLGATPDMAPRPPKLNLAQLYFLSPAAAKLLLAIANHRSAEVVIKQAGLADETGLSRRTVTRALDELRLHRLIDTAEWRSGKGYVSGLRIRLLPVPGSLPKTVAASQRERLQRRRTTLHDQLTQIEREMEILDSASPAELSG